MKIEVWSTCGGGLAGKAKFTDERDARRAILEWFTYWGGELEDGWENSWPGEESDWSTALAHLDEIANGIDLDAALASVLRGDGWGWAMDWPEGGQMEIRARMTP